MSDDAIGEIQSDMRDEVVRARKRARRRKITDRSWAVVMTILILIGFYAVYTTYLNHQQNDTILSQNHTILAQNHTIKSLSMQNTASSAENKVLLKRLSDEAEAIEFEGGVIAYQNGEILKAHQQTDQVLADISQLQKELGSDFSGVSAALIQGQAEINAFLNYLTCLAGADGSTSMCGPAPPLPSTNGGN